MLKFLNKFFNNQQNKQIKENFEFAERLVKKHIRYACERLEYDSKDDEIITDEIVIGKEGYFNINQNGELELFLSGVAKEIFRVNIAEMKAGELMSLEGAIIEAFDLSQNKWRKIIAYYKYYR